MFIHRLGYGRPILKFLDKNTLVVPVNILHVWNIATVMTHAHSSEETLAALPASLLASEVRTPGAQKPVVEATEPSPIAQNVSGEGLGLWFEIGD